MLAPPLPERHIIELQPSTEDCLGVHNLPHAALQPSKRTQSPSVTGTSVLAIKYDKGIMLAADTLGEIATEFEEDLAFRVERACCSLTNRQLLLMCRFIWIYGKIQIIDPITASWREHCNRWKWRIQRLSVHSRAIN
jgi:hypothetical protein